MLCSLSAQITKLCNGPPISSVRNYCMGPEWMRWLLQPTLASPMHFVSGEKAPCLRDVQICSSCSTHSLMVINLGGSQIFLSLRMLISVLSFTLMSTSTKVCSPLILFCRILPQKLSGFHFSVQRGTETTSPKRQTCNPQHPTALMMLALWITFTSMPNFTALRQRSECVVAQKASPTTRNAQLPSGSFEIRTSKLSISTSQKSRSAQISSTSRNLARS